ncbi:MAG: DUF3300 domain-containing protein [Candidatus Acidiferrum sp.]|jgi:hypothetical protein
MNSKNPKKLLSLVLSLVLVSTSSQLLYGYQSQGAAPAQDTGTPTEAAPQSAAELQALVAPIALYPDSLVAQILTAATFPDEVAIASYWVGQNKSLTGSALMQAVDKQTWDASVKALTEFASVLDNMAKNLTWTSSLGEAYHNQQSDVMTAIQTLRAEAKAKGNLKSSSQVTVVQQSPQVIVIQPTNPQIVYVPEYNPTIVYGTPYVVPEYVAPVYTTGDVVAAGLIGFGAGIAVGAMMSHGCCSWGYSSWNCGWHGTAVVYHGGAYYGNSAWHGGYYNGGYHGSNGYNNSYNHNNYNNNYNHSNYNNNYKNSSNSYNKNVSGNTMNVNKQGSQNSFNDHSSASNSWAQHDSGSSEHSNAFSGSSGHSGGSNGWSSKADSSRGWGSMHSSGFSGGRFGGGGSGGGGFRR